MNVRNARSFSAAALLAVALSTVPAFAQEQQGEHAEPYVSLDRSVLDDETRPADERAQDPYRKVLEVYEWFGIEPGLVVADVMPGGGYNTHILSRLMGETPVYAILGPLDGFTLDPEVPTYDVRLNERVAASGLDNVVVASDYADVPDGALDVAIIIRNYHDLGNYFEDRPGREELEKLYRCVKPGGIVGVVDVATDRPGWDDETHRLNKSVVIEDFEAIGFELVDESDMLANPDDDHSTSGFREGRHKADRYLLKFRRPANAS